ncbi:MAG TPA: fibronectin type III domain-containing protein [Candidatus Limnocylindria bacterium]|nr:fibronectin type III domain-containing protein [Candidatus Limnocylindria bacterium]
MTLAPINPVHLALMHNGKILFATGSGNDKTVTFFQGGVFDPVTDTTTTQPLTWDLFCNGMVVLPDGRPFIMGGTINYNPFQGSNRTTAFDPASGNFVDLQSMAHGRWYPTSTVLPDGRVMVFSGLTETGGTNVAVEIYKVGAGWSQQYMAPFTPPLYPRMHVLPNGKVFFSGSTAQSWTFDPSNQSWTAGPTTNYGNTRTYGSSVLLPLTPANGYNPKVLILGGASPSTATTELIDLSAASPKWVNGPSMVQPRIEMNATILPNGKILTSGGSQIDEDGTTASLKAELYDPTAGATGAFTSAGSNTYPRLYHSNTILLPDATVLMAGSNPRQGAYDPHMEIYSPPYLFNSNGTLATRPTIASVTPGVIGYNGAFQVQTPDAANITSAVLIRAGAVTHSFDMDQRLVGLVFTAGSGVLNLTSPPNSNIAPPGYYLLFILNSSGVPSGAQFVQLSLTPTDLSPTGTIVTPTSNVAIGPGQSVSFSGTGSDPDGTVAAYNWVFPSGSPSSSSSQNPGSVSFANPGTYIASLTVTDNVGLTDPSPATRTITVTPDFSLTFSPATQTVVAGNGTSYTINVVPGPNFTGSVSFSASGLPSGASATFNPATVTTSGSTTMTVSTSAGTPIGNSNLTVTGTSGASSHSVTPVLSVIVSADTIPPTAPTNLTATASSNLQINLSWTAATDNVGVTGNKVERCQGAGCTNFGQITTLGAVTSYTDTSLQPSTSYSYRIRANDAAGNIGAYSNVASATTPAAPPPPIKFVQQVALTTGSGVSTASQTFTIPSVSGDLIVVGVKWGNQAISVASIGDDKGNNYTNAVGPTNWSGTAKRAQIFYAKNIIGGGAPITITVTLTGIATSSFYIYQLEYSNADINAPLDVVSAAIGTSTFVSSGSATTNFPNELIFGFSIADSVGINPGPGFTAESTFRGNLVEDMTVSTTGSYAALGTETGVSNWFMLMAAFKAANADTTPPTTPSGLTALATGPTQVNLSWTASTDNVGVSGYVVQRCSGSGCTNFAQVASLPGNTTAYDDTSLAPSTTYTYQIVSTDAAVNLSLPSNPASATTQADTTPPTAPTNLAATVAGNTQINLSWTASTDNVGVTNYLIQRCATPGCSNFAQIGTTGGPGTTYNDAAASASTSYTYQVIATDAAGNPGLPSNTATAVTMGPPATPSALTATAASATQINLSWTNDAINQSGFKVERSPDNVTFTQIGTTSATAYSDPNLAPKILYYYRVRATNASGDSGYSNVSSATTLPDTTPPTAPSNLTATAASSTQINLSWTASTDNVGVTGYQIQRCQGVSCTTLSQIAAPTGTGTTYVDTGLSPSTSYSYEIIAADAAGNQSLPSNLGTATTLAGPPAIPSNLTATAAGATQINLLWTNNATNQTGFKVERSPDNVTFTQIATTGATITTYSDSPLAPVTLYYYRVRATNGSGDSTYSNLASSTTLADTTPPTAPTNLTATATSSSQNDLSWTASTDNVGVTGYKIQRCQGTGCTTFAQIATPPGTGTTFSDTGLSPSTSYSYEIIAVDAAGNASSPSNVGSAMTLAGAPAAPSGLAATAASATQINLSWTNNAINQTGFKVERSPDGVAFMQIGITTGATTTYSDPTLLPLTIYYYRVRATNSVGDSAYSNISSATTLADTTPPTAPANLTATAASSTQINLTWAASTDNVGVTQYQVQRCQGAACATLAQVGTSTTPSFADTGLLPATSYSYQVRALDTANNASPFSNIATTVTQSAAPPPPVTFAQHTETSVLSGTSTISQTFPAASISGNLIIVSVKWGNQALSVSSVTDNKGNVYTSAVGPTNWNGTLKSAQTFYAKNIVGGGAPITITVTLTGNSNSSFHLYQFEYTNIDPANPIDTTCAAAGVGTAISCGPVTTNFANDLLYAVAFNDSAVTNGGAGFTTLSTYHSNLMESMQTTAAGSYTGAASNTLSTSWFMQLLAIKRHP